MEPIIHLFLPVICLLAIFPKIPKKYVFLLAPLTFLMDFDLFLEGFHRIIFHNLTFVIIVALIIYIFINKRAFFISLYYLFSHLILDLAYPGSAWFYPFIQKTFYIDFSILFNKGFYITSWLGSLTISEFRMLTGDGYSTIVSLFGLMFLLLIFILVISYLQSSHAKP